jgi:hypothetical protein
MHALSTTTTANNNNNYKTKQNVGADAVVDEDGDSDPEEAAFALQLAKGLFKTGNAGIDSDDEDPDDLDDWSGDDAMGTWRVTNCNVINMSFQHVP